MNGPLPGVPDAAGRTGADRRDDARPEGSAADRSGVAQVPDGRGVRGAGVTRGPCGSGTSCPTGPPVGSKVTQP